MVTLKLSAIIIGCAKWRCWKWEIVNLFTLVFFTVAMRVTVVTSDSANRNCFWGDWPQKEERYREKQQETEKEKMKKGQRVIRKLMLKDVMKWFLVFEMTGHMKSQSYPLFYPDRKPVHLCWKESALFRVLWENRELLLFFCIYYVHLLLFVCN